MQTVNVQAPPRSDEVMEQHNPSPALTPGARPSLWSAVWVLLALVYLTGARITFARLGR